jgi:hypothetical protein
VKLLAGSAIAVVVGVMLLLPNGRAAAQFEPAGALTASVAFASEGAGGGLVGDITAPIGPLRLGATVGAVAISSENASVSRVFVPLGLSIGLVGRPGGWWFEARVRAGAWAGATNEGLAAGPWLSPGAFVGVALGPQVALGVGVDGWFAFGHGTILAVAPGLTLTWVPWDLAADG